MFEAVELSRAVAGRTSPNPAVGALIFDAGGYVCGAGTTAPPGGPHAEAAALAQAGARARGGTAVVTLEPCDHTGRTGPCSRALIEAGVARVVFAIADPTAQASGGAETLRRAGVEVVGGVSAADVEAGPLRPWLHRQRTGRAEVTLKIATTIDGRVAAPDGTSRWITGEAARAEVHARRARVDAIVVGTGTVLADDPALTARNPDGSLRGHQPLRVVVGDRPMPAGSRILDSAARTLVIRDHDPAGVIERLSADCCDVQIEGGPRLAGAFLGAGLVDRIEHYLAPAVLGDGRAAVVGSGARSIADLSRFRLRMPVRALGDDVLLTYDRVTGR
ncbi:bifunctional diaminohydroxyphosphoribosylaminopyrimidine deaminase/5-amino-6-(5-phosphoribosylamino)uracil reductase RibD [Tomitella fengzijianii]|uniref:Riboflavin biosynthesis protein RibD n=1 Tax=Tomitella fengzijianii TaxID=2597660 RepID=A0A516X815_9ACTN|nr:bifunctional diaminohydroxyphosphoribosylaminopyrimidine deaminase/5-amino-6-(5-phosphoribosylamino)uracil reductase RibD [Tomitella fengzijianii]QDQ99200.1 bifunctional diaminohydroxyphosphoribosylaminopyrimidine deaminase/5-amino-6-(5-phosphoribosylamino)uracil reductase RibD [Tomitella fengzijianii]